MKVVTSKEYFVTQRNTGTEYLTERTTRTATSGKYHWVKRKDAVALVTYNAAQKLRQRYGGKITCVTTTVQEESV